MQNNIAPSQPYYDRTSADVAQAAIPAGILNTMIMNSVQQASTPGGMEDMSGLLAAILKTQAKGSAKYRIYPFFVAAGNSQQILPDNPQRTALIVSVTGTGPIFLDLEQGPLSPTASQDTILARCITVSSAPNVQPLFDFFVSPTNAITVVASGVDAVGVLLEGM